jgi:hypothetical protein
MPVRVVRPATSRLSVSREIDARHDAPAKRRVRRNPRIDDGHPDARAGNAGQPVEALPHLVGANRHVGDRHRRADVLIARHVIRVRRERVEPPRRDGERRAVLQPLAERQPVAQGQDIQVRRRTGDDHFRLSQIPRRQSPYQVLGQAGPPAACVGVPRRTNQHDRRRQTQNPYAL